MVGCVWPLADYQAKLACEEIIGNYQRPTNMSAAVTREMLNPHFSFQKSSSAPRGRKKYYKDFSKTALNRNTKSLA